MQVILDQIAAVSPQFQRRVIFQRPPTPNEQQTDDLGYPLSGYTDIDPTHPIPCSFVASPGRELLIAGQQRSITLYTFTTPDHYQTVDGNGDTVWGNVVCSAKYRAKVLAFNGDAEQIFQVTGVGDDVTPANIFQAVLLEDLI
jgi:hypothetical protein